MEANDTTTRETPTTIFDDPVAYLARLGMSAELIEETVMPAAA
jgi:hypothetical protein